MTVSQRAKEVAVRLFLRYFRFVALAVAVIILGLGYLTVLSPKFREVREVGLIGLRAKQSALDERREYRQRLQGMVDAFNRNISESDVAFLERAVPRGPQIPNLLSVLNGLAAENGFTVESVSVSEQGDTAKTPAKTGDASKQLNTVLEAVRGQTANPAGGKLEGQELNIRLTLSGPVGYESARRLLNAVEASERIFDIESLSFSLAALSGGPGQEATNETKYDVSINSIYLPETASAK